MRDFFEKYKNIILFAGIVLVLFLGYWFFFGRSDDAVLSSTSTQAGAAQESQVGQELLTLLLDLRAIDLDASIFSDPAFRSLEDFGRELIPEPAGRQNPFAPIGSDPIGVPQEEDSEAGEVETP